jgi:hypothetical protein
MMLFIGDVHGDWMRLITLVMQHGLGQQAIIQVGDFGVGFDTVANDRARLQILNTVLEQRDLTLYVVRGNHDDPSWFHDHRHDLDRIRLVCDYETLLIDGQHILCVGGAVSIDRRLRQREQLGWWAQEGVRLCLDQLTGQPDMVVTHSAPDFCPPHRLGALVHEFARHDPALLADIAAERQALTLLFKALDRQRLRLWVYGHFHQRLEHEHAGVRFRGLPELGGLVVPTTHPA